MSKGNGVHARRAFGLYEEPLATAGIRKNRFHAFMVTMQGKDWYEALEFFEGIASRGGDYITVRKAVMYAEEWRRQLQAQGF